MKGTFSKALFLTLISTGAASTFAMERFTKFFAPKNAHTIAVDYLVAAQKAAELAAQEAAHQIAVDQIMASLTAELSAKQAVELAAQEAAKAAEAVENVAQAAWEASDVNFYAPAVASKLEQAQAFVKRGFEAAKQSSAVQYSSDLATKAGNYVTSISKPSWMTLPTTDSVKAFATNGLNYAKSMVPTSKPAWMAFPKVSMPQISLPTTDAVKTLATSGVEFVKNNPADAATIAGAVVVGGYIAYQFGKGLYNRLTYQDNMNKIFAKSTAQANAKAAKKAQNK